MRSSRKRNHNQDLSSHPCRNELALAEAIALAEEHQAEVSVVHVLKTDWRYEMLENPPEIGLELVDARQQLDACISKLKSTRKINAVLVRCGPVGEAVLRAALQNGADLLVLGLPSMKLSGTPGVRF